MPRKENTKAKTWERDRRNRMNGYFKNLSDLLPPLLEGRKRNKIDILIHASKYIKDLQNRTDELFNAQASDAHREELARLKRLVAQLISRTQLLSELLKNAGITAPAEPALEKISPLKWSNRINVEPGFKLVTPIETVTEGKKKKEKSNKSLKSNLRKKYAKIKKAEKPSVQSKCVSEKCTSENQENHVDSNEKKNEEDDSVTAGAANSEDAKNKKGVACKKKNKEMDKSSSQDVVDIPKNLPAGALVLSKGKLMPIVTPMPALTSNIIMNAQACPSNSIILNGAQQTQMIVVQPFQATSFQTVSTVQTMTLNSVPTNVLINPQDWAKNVKTIIDSSKIGGAKGILPKIREVTETTMTYKVPIPAIHKDKSNNKSDNKSKLSNKKSAKSAPKTIKINEKSTSVKAAGTEDDDKKCSVTSKIANDRPLKRNLNSVNEKNSKKLKSDKDEKVANVEKKGDTVTCKSIENLKQVIEKIGEDSTLEKLKSPKLDVGSAKAKEETNVANESNNVTSVSLNSLREEKSNATSSNSSETLRESTEIEKETKSDKTSCLEVEKSKTASQERNVEESKVNSAPDEPIQDTTDPAENNKVFLNLDTNTTTTMRLENPDDKAEALPLSDSPSAKRAASKEEEDVGEAGKRNAKESQSSSKSIVYSPNNSFIPINHKSDSMHSDLSNDIFASLHVPSSSNNSESVSPTAAFLMAFPIVSQPISGKTEVLDDEMKDEFKYSSQTPPMLLQIGAIEPNNFKIHSKGLPSDQNDATKSTVQAKSSTDLALGSSSSTTVAVTTTTTTVSSKALPRVICSQTLAEPFKIVPASSEQQQQQQEVNDCLDTTKAGANVKLPRDSSEIKPNAAVAKDERVDDAGINQFNFQCQTSSGNDRSELCKLQICSIDDFAGRGNKVDARSAETPVSSSNSSEFAKKSQAQRQDQQISKGQSQLQSKVEIKKCCGTNNESNVTIVNNGNENADGKNINSNDTDMSLFHHKKSENLPASNSYLGLCDNNPSKIPRREEPVSSQASHSAEKSIITSNNDAGNIPRSNNIFSQQTDAFVNSSSTASYADASRSASNSSNLGILSWSMLSSPLNNVVTNNSSSNSGTANTNFSQYEQVSTSSSTTNTLTLPPSDQISKAPCNSYNYLSLSKDDVSFSSSNSNSQVPVFDKPKAKLSLDGSKKSYGDSSNNKPRNVRSSQTSAAAAPASVTSVPKQNRSYADAEYKYPTENKNKYKYPMDVDYGLNGYSVVTSASTTSSSSTSGVGVVHHQHQQSHRQLQNQSSSSHQQSLKANAKTSASYAISDFDAHANFSLESSEMSARYASGSQNSSYSGGADFKYADSKNLQAHSKYQVSSQHSTLMLQDNSLYKNKLAAQNQQQQQQQQQQPHANAMGKAKVDLQTTAPIIQGMAVQQQQQQQQQETQSIRPPVNWMMTPDVKMTNSNANVYLSPFVKDMDFCQNNTFSAQSSNHYNQSSTNQQFYGNYEMGNSHAAPNEPRRSVDATYYVEEQQQQQQQFSWSPTKNLVHASEQSQTTGHVKSSSTSETVPALVADLALGVGSSSALDKQQQQQQNFTFSQTTNLHSNEFGKDALKGKADSSGQSRGYQAMIGGQSNSSHGMAFLSVSQLVEHEKAEKVQQVHAHHQQQQQQQQQQHLHQQQQQPPRKQRKSNSGIGPRASSKRQQMDMRQKQQQQQTTSEQVHHQRDNDKASSSFADAPNYQQQQKYNQQNDVQWRSRNCKSNYTAEALIGASSDTNKSASKFPNYAQNKFTGNHHLAVPPSEASVNYFSSVDESSAAGYGQVVNQNLNHSYAYSNNIYPAGNFIGNISSSSSSNYMLHDNVAADYLNEANNFLLANNVPATPIPTTSSTAALIDAKNQQNQSQPQHQHHYHQQQQQQQSYGTGANKHHKRLPSFGQTQQLQQQQPQQHHHQQQQQQQQQQRKSKNSQNAVAQSLDFNQICSGSIDDYQSNTFLSAASNSLYVHSNQTNSSTASMISSSSTSSSAPSIVPSTAASSLTSNSMIMGHHSHHPHHHHHNHHHHPHSHHQPPGTSLTNFNLSTIFPEINDKVQASSYKSSANVMPSSAVTQPTSHASTSNYQQRNSFADPLGQMSQVNRHC